MFDGILFDLDGTLWDSTPALAGIWSLIFARHPELKRGPIDVPEVRSCMGLLLPDIARKLFPDQPDEVRMPLNDEFVALAPAYLAEHRGEAYPGAAEVLEHLAKTARLFVVSNCQEGYIEGFYEATGLGRFFSGNECAGHTGLPKSENIKLVVERYRLKNPVYIGDTMLDYTSARDAGVPFLHAAYGFGQVPGVPAVAGFAEIPAALEAMSPT